MILVIGHRMGCLSLHFTFLCLQVTQPLDLPGTQAIVCCRKGTKGTFLAGSKSSVVQVLGLTSSG